MTSQGNADQITGTSGADTLQGGAGPDLIYGFDPNSASLANVSSITATRVATGLSQPVYAVAAPGDLNHLFIVDRTGQIQILDLGTGQLTTFLDISSDVTTAGEGGLLGLAFDPNYAQNGYFYVDLTNTSDNTEVRRYQVSAGNPQIADPNSALPIITVTQPGTTNHKAGWISFGADGDLYVALGDGGGGGDPLGNGQNPQSLLAKILRLDVHGDDFPNDPTRNYAIPTDNPFVGVAGVAPEIYALGLRNPYRDSFDRDLGTFYIGDVGQDKFEEIDIGKAGANYGWNVFEGNSSFQPGPLGPGTLTSPIYTYDHTVGHAIIGGYINRGESEALQGQYFFGDDVDNKFFTLQQQTDGSWVATDRSAQLNFTSGGSLANPTSFAEDGLGNIYMLELGGDVFKLTPNAAAADAGDSLHGGGGSDTIYGGSGNDTIFGDAGDDVIYGGGGSNILLGGDGNDTLISDGGNDTIDGGLGADNVNLGSGNATVYGGAGDTIGGVLGAFLTFDAGTNALTLNATSGGSATVNLDSGETVTGGAAAVQIGAASGDDITLGSAADIVNALAGNDTVTLGSGDATVYGAAKDTIGSQAGIFATVNSGGNPIVLTSTAGVVRINLGAGDAITAGAATAQIGAAAGNSIALGTGADTVNAAAGNDLVTVGSGNATVYGAAGDTIAGALGAFIVFNAGTTQFTFNATSGGIATVNLNTGKSVTGGAAVVQIGAAAGDSITLGTAPDTVNALAGNDTVTLGSGDATVYGAAGDQLNDPSGTFLTYDAGSNSIVLNSTGGTTVINLNIDDTVTAGGAAAQIGAATGDDITLGSGADTVNALAGNDTVTLGSGDATVYGAAGDTLGSASGIFAAFLAGAAPIVLTSTGGNTVLNIGGGDTIAAGTTVEAILANGPADAISLGAGNDTVNIGAGNDSLALGTGTATVFGGAGDTITTGAAGSANINFIAGHSGGEFLGPGSGSGSTQVDTVTNFNQAAGDRILESGAAATTTMQTAQSSGGNTVITLSDGSTVTLVGVASIGPTFFQ